MGSSCGQTSGGLRNRYAKGKSQGQGGEEGKGQWEGPICRNRDHDNPGGSREGSGAEVQGCVRRGSRTKHKAGPHPGGFPCVWGLGAHSKCDPCGWGRGSGHPWGPPVAAVLGG